MYIYLFTSLFICYYSSICPSIYLYIYLSIYISLFINLYLSIYQFISVYFSKEFDFQHSLAFIKENKKVMTGVNKIMEKINNLKSENLETLRRTIAPVQEKITIFIRFAEERSQKYVKC